MRVVIAGGHGKIALLLTRALADAGHQAVGLVRNPAHEEEVVAAGGQAVVLDLEQASVETVADVLTSADVAVFAAGAGPGSGAARKDTVDRGAAVLFADASERAGVRRHLQIGSMGADHADDPELDATFAAYLRAKWAAEEDLRARDLDWTILRPGGLTDDPATGTVQLAGHTGRGQVTRADVAAVVVALSTAPAAVGRTLELIGGDTPVATAVASL